MSSTINHLPLLSNFTDSISLPMPYSFVIQYLWSDTAFCVGAIILLLTCHALSLGWKSFANASEITKEIKSFSILVLTLLLWITKGNTFIIIFARSLKTNTCPRPIYMAMNKVLSLFHHSLISSLSLSSPSNFSTKFASFFRF